MSRQDKGKKEKLTRAEKKATKKVAKEERKKKPKTLRDRVLTIIEVLLVCIILVCAYSIGDQLYEYYKAQKLYDSISEIALPDSIWSGDIDFDALLEINSSVVGWIYQEDTVINYPVVKGSDNSTYLTTAFDGTYSGSGTLFVDYRNADDFADFNNVIYGHHMKNGTMFGGLKEYLDESYYEEHPTFYFVTKDAKYTLEIIAFYTTSSTSDTYTLKFSTDAEKEEFLEYTMSNSEYTTGVTATIDDTLITLSTCAYEFDGARYVVVCKMVPWDDEE